MPEKKERLDWFGQLILDPIKMHLTDIAVSGLPDGLRERSRSCLRWVDKIVTRAGKYVIFIMKRFLLDLENWIGRNLDNQQKQFNS